MSDETTRTDQWLWETLTGSTALSAILTGGWYADEAPRGTTTPFGVYVPIPLDDRQTSSADRIFAVSLYRVSAVAEAESWGGDLQSAADLIDALLHRADGTAGGAVILSSTRVAPWRRISDVDGKRYRSLGGEYRILTQL